MFSQMLPSIACGTKRCLWKRCIGIHNGKTWDFGDVLCCLARSVNAIVEVYAFDMDVTCLA